VRGEGEAALLLLPSFSLGYYACQSGLLAEIGC
jgi:hypothetical protein